MTVDAVILCEDESLILIKRKYDPYKGSWALPGGFVEWGETVESAVVREAKEETGLEVDIIGMVGVYSDPERDPRGHTVTVCYLTRKTGGSLKADTDASSARYFSKDEILKLKLAFDHDIILKDAFKLLDNCKT